MYASMTQKIFGEIYPGLAQTDLNNGTYVPGVSTNGQALFAPETSDHPSSTLGVVDVHGSRSLFDMPGGPLALAVGGQYIHKAQNATNPPSVVSGAQNGVIAYAVGSQDDTAGFVELRGQADQAVGNHSRRALRPLRYLWRLGDAEGRHQIHAHRPICDSRHLG